MTTTKITNIHNKSGAPVWLFDIENSGNNTIIPKAKFHNAEFNVPWVDNEKQFLTKALVLTTDKGLIGYLWQHKDRLYFTKNGWQKANEGYRLPKYSNIGAPIELTIDAKGSVFGEKAVLETSPVA